ncbi:MAG TPA: glycosyltransferase family 4 protein [Candidatus Limnocylindria bacterium]|nr:glycosyltransferase family 4 protein [Candidatus Limnocylindria bacterium]
MSRPVAVHLTSVHPPDDARIAARECRALRDAGLSIALVAPHVGRSPFPDLPTFMIQRPSGRFWRMLLSPWRVMMMGVSLKAEIYHLHDPELIPAGLVLKLLGKRVVYDVHENLPKQVLGKRWLPRWLRPVAAQVASLVERVADASFDAIVVANATSLSRFRNPRAVLVGNYADVREFPQSAQPMAYRDRPPLIAYVGAISRERGLIQMVDAMAMVQHPGAMLVLAGPMPDDLLELVALRPGWDRVAALGWHSRSEVHDLLGRARIGIAVLHPLPNYLDNYPSKLFEYMASGIPAIVSNFPLWREVVIKAECGLVVDPMDARAIAGAIDALLGDPEGAEAAGGRGRVAIQERLNWAIESEKLIQLYRELTRRTA